MIWLVLQIFILYRPFTIRDISQPTSLSDGYHHLVNINVILIYIRQSAQGQDVNMLSLFLQSLMPSYNQVCTRLDRFTTLLNHAI